MTRLYIIGNGFDLWHGLPTGYDRFSEFAKTTLEDIEGYFSSDAAHDRPWNDFERSLGTFNCEQFYDDNNNLDIESDSFSLSHISCLEDDLSEQADNIVDSIRDCFRDWIEEIDISVAKKKLDFPKEASFITFNYTSTLQSVYGIGTERILHLHGRADTDEVIFGHGETTETEPDFDEDGEPTRTAFSDADGTAKYPLYAFRKPVEDVLKNHHKVFESFGHVSEIVVIGHSLNTIDLPYYRRLAVCAPTARWIVCCYEETDNVHHVEALVSCGVTRESIRTCTYSHLEAEHSSACVLFELI